MVRSRLIVGSVGTGKSEFIRSEFLRYAEARETACLLFEPHGQTAQKIMLDLDSRGRTSGGRVLYDRLGRFDRVLAAIQPKQSTSANPWVRQQENMSQILGYANLFYSAGQREETGSLMSHPMTITWLVNALALILYQPQQTSLLALNACFSPGTEEFDRLVDSCTDNETKYQWTRIGLLYKARSFRDLESQLGGAQRLIQTVLKLPEFAARLSGSFDLRRALENKAVIILDGSEAIPESRTALIRGWNLQVFGVLREHFAETGKPLPTLICIDEAPASNAIGPAEVDFLREMRKAGGSLWIAGQDLSFIDEQIKKAVKGSCPEHVWFRPVDDELALEAARDIGYATLNPFEVHHNVSKFRPRLKEVPRVSVTTSDHGESVSESMQFISDPEEYQEAVYRSPNDQVMDVTPILQNLKAGEYLYRSPEGTSRTPIYSPMIPDPYPEIHFPGLAAKKLERAISQSQSLPEFTTPIALELSWHPTTTPSPGKGTPQPKTFSKKTRRPPNS